VIPPARTGSESNSKIAVIKTDHKYNGIFRNVTSLLLKNKIVTIKFIAPNKDETPAMCKLNMVKSTAAPGCASIPAKGG